MVILVGSRWFKAVLHVVKKFLFVEGCVTETSVPVAAENNIDLAFRLIRSGVAWFVDHFLPYEWGRVQVIGNSL